MDTFPTLQEFVLNLIYDPSARSAFELDPESALHAAGLGDITAADVQQVIPLVVDSAPVTGLHSLTGPDDLTTGVANLDVAGAVSHLQAITAQVDLTPAHLSAEVNGGFNSVAAISVAGDPAVGAALDANMTFNWTGLSGLSVSADPDVHLDHQVYSPVEHAVTGVAPGVGGIVPGLDAGPAGILDNGLDTFGNLPSSAPLDHLPSLDGAGLGGATSSIGSVITPDLGHVLSQDPVDTVHGAVSGVTGTVSGVTGTVGDVLHGVTGETAQEHGLLGDLHL